MEVEAELDMVETSDPARRVRVGHSRHTAGRMIAVTGLSSAPAALAEIVEEGEDASRGAVRDGDPDVHHTGRDEVAHHYRFQELRAGRRYRRGDTPRTGPTGEPVGVDFAAGVLPMRPDPKIADHAPGSAIRTAQDGPPASRSRRRWPRPATATSAPTSWGG
ncbi:ferritin-like protein [Actinomadura verrucosospora]|uniref:Iminophenyl-pyruvate dimer synthase domain-containing protein n=1 Tax=Actinomadura verrucosospora TaxID=46165 RepID=A0A7D3W2R2_ACTVE|nr:ferritin-like protein [Actinomadura verrucosospora]QKG27114.1 hypothetical protein ACTIVE_8767 [Actinomadura verrucosospora]